MWLSITLTFDMIPILEDLREVTLSILKHRAMEWSSFIIVERRDSPRAV